MSILKQVLTTQMVRYGKCLSGHFFAGGFESSSAHEIAYPALGLLIAAGVTLVVFRSRALSNRWGRQMSGLLIVVLAMFAASAGLVAARGGSAAEASADAMASLAGVMGAGGLGLDPRLLIAALGCAVAAVVCHLHPPSSPLALGLAGVVAVAMFLPESIRNSRAPAPAPPS